MKKLEKEYKGVIVPMITPFNKDLSIDQEAVKRIINAFIEADVSPFILGTTGESASVSEDQMKVFVSMVIGYVKKQVKVYVGISSNCLQATIDNAKMCAEMGADAVVAHPPCYYPLTSNGILRYFEELADNIPCPLIIYNNPMTTNHSIPLEIIDKLSYQSNIVGLKDSERDIERLNRSIELWSERNDFVHLVGWAAQSFYALQKGSDGIVPSIGNLVPNFYKELYNAIMKGELVKAEELQLKTDKISEICYNGKNLSQSIASLKSIMSVYNLCQPYVMPPLYNLDYEEENRIKVLIKQELDDHLIVVHE
ncbi:dihydrodipicolinate synthase family protein [Bacteroidota bacterium]